MMGLRRREDGDGKLERGRRALHTTFPVIPVKTGIQEVLDNTGYRPAPV